MMKSGKRSAGWLALAAIVMLALPSVGSVIGSTAGRNYSRCVQSCNAVNKTCGIQCQTDCRALYTTKAERDACISACKDICFDEMTECKQICHDIKNPPSPEEP